MFISHNTVFLFTRVQYNVNEPIINKQIDIFCMYNMVITYLPIPIL